MEIEKQVLLRDSQHSAMKLVQNQSQKSLLVEKTARDAMILLVSEMRILCGQNTIDPEDVKAQSAIWAKAMLHASIPIDWWPDAFEIGRRSRPAASKAFQPTVDQIIDAWEKTRRGMIWDVCNEEWTRSPEKVEYFSVCRNCYGSGRKLSDPSNSHSRLIKCDCIGDSDLPATREEILEIFRSSKTRESEYAN
jgi:hypothetical protein